MKIIDLFEEHEKEMAGEVLKYALCDVRGRWFVGALEAIYEGLVEELRGIKEAEARRREFYATALTKATSKEERETVSDGPQVASEDAHEAEVADANRKFVQIFGHSGQESDTAQASEPGPRPCAERLGGDASVAGEGLNAEGETTIAAASETLGIAQHTLRRIIHAAGLKPHRIEPGNRQFYMLDDVRSAAAKPKCDFRKQSDVPAAKVEALRKYLKKYPGATFKDMMADCHMNASWLKQARAIIAAELVDPSGIQKPFPPLEPESVEPQAQEPDEPFVAPSGFTQPTKTQHNTFKEEPPKPRKVDVDQIGFQKRILCLRELAATGDKSQAGKVSGLLPEEVVAVGQRWLADVLHRMETLEPEFALAAILRVWSNKGVDPDSLPAARRSA